MNHDDYTPSYFRHGNVLLPQFYGHEAGFESEGDLGQVALTNAAAPAKTWFPSGANDIMEAYGISKALAVEIVRVAKRVGISDPAFLANVINFESRFNPQIQNKKHWHKGCGGGYATGLLQFVPCTAAELGVTVSRIKNMSAIQQMQYVERYFRLPRITKYGSLTRQNDVFMAVFYPEAIGKGPNYVFPASVQAANYPIKTPGDYVKLAEGSLKIGGAESSRWLGWVPVLKRLPRWAQWPLVGAGVIGLGIGIWKLVD